MRKFKFDIGQQVMIAISGESGEVIGRAEYADSENSYFLRYKDAQGMAREEWWREGALR